MLRRRYSVVRRLSGLRARLVQSVDGRPGSAWLARWFPAQLGSLPPRRPTGMSPGVADLARPIRCPQRRRRTLVLAEIPPCESDGLARLVRRARRRRIVTVTDAAATPQSVLVLSASGAQIHVRDDVEPDGLDAAVVERLRAPLGETDRDLELRSIRLRRLAHDRLWAVPSGRSVSVLLASHRPADIGAALEQIARQVDIEVQVVVGLHGDRWPADAAAQLGPLPEGSIVARFGPELPLGSVLDELAARAECDLVTKWDDDDWYGQDHLADLVRAYEYSGADVVGKAAEFVWLEASDLTIRRFAIGAESYSSTVAGGTILTSAEWLEEIGGWEPIPRNVDMALLRSTQRCGGRSYRTHGFQYVLRRRAGDGHTWYATDANFVKGAAVRRHGLDLSLADIRAVGEAAVEHADRAGDAS